MFEHTCCLGVSQLRNVLLLPPAGQRKQLYVRHAVLRLRLKLRNTLAQHEKQVVKVMNIFSSVGKNNSQMSL